MRVAAHRRGSGRRRDRHDRRPTIIRRPPRRRRRRPPPGRGGRCRGRRGWGANGSATLDASTPRPSRRSPGRHRVDVVVNACDPRFNPPIFEAAFRAGAHYLDMAMNLSSRTRPSPTSSLGIPLGEAQLAAHEDWASAGSLPLVGMGVEPGLSDVFARYAADHLFSVDRRDRRPRRRQPRHRRLRLRPDVLDLDDDRGVPEPADRLRARTRLVHDGAVQRARDASTSQRASARSSA